MAQRMNQYASEIMDVKNIALDFNSDATLSSLKLSMEQRKNIYLFFKEVINNVVKYSDASRVLVSIIKQGRYAEMKICDNGKGFNITEVASGNGMSSLKKRATELKGDFKITSQAKEGTSVELRFKIEKSRIFDMLEISRMWLI
jgi:signal transduction histidine kinase